MGLENQLSDVSSESLLVCAVVLMARGVGYLNSLFLTILSGLGFSPNGHRHNHAGALYDVVGSGLAGLIVLCEQMNLNRACSGAAADADLDGDCVVCLNPMREGDVVRRLLCRHAFHKDCFDGWLDHLNFNCPLCRTPLVSEERMSLTQSRVAEDLLAWFPFR
ncbi:E3 ubiquitin-protein ligase RHA2A-like [Andrographis paniculata]|uniref:E3 ubiquitin-protein ligase RHA2A-like n=1 Tax=Andrographis paniculata TaxID=175694 RepID=UPI0021E86421|nr:E3 ubiquitin-protein ligase RHA2A-like [Andrographis paniculata]